MELHRFTTGWVIPVLCQGSRSRQVQWWYRWLHCGGLCL